MNLSRHLLQLAIEAKGSTGTPHMLAESPNLLSGSVSIQGFNREAKPIVAGQPEGPSTLSALLSEETQP
jgi:hypothetical protein